MRKVMQTRTGVGGNCFQAAVASIMHMRLYEVPDFCNQFADNWWNAFVEWLKPLGYTAIMLDVRGVRYSPLWGVGSMALISGESPRVKGVLHTIVSGRNQLGDRWFHDPAPYHQGLKGKAKDYIFILPLSYSSRKGKR